jgi:hypothetical protein
LSCFTHPESCPCEECSEVEVVTVAIPCSVLKAILGYQRLTIKRGRRQTTSEVVSMLLRSALMNHPTKEQL